MFKLKNLLVSLIFVIPNINYGQYTDQINSNRPGETISAFSVGKSVYQIETGVYGIKENNHLSNTNASGFGLDMTLRFGVLSEKLELIADMQYQKEKFNTLLKTIDKSAMKKTVFGAKYLIYDPFKNYKKVVNVYSWKANHSFEWHKLIPAISVFAGANFNFSDNPYSPFQKTTISPKIILITQNHFSDGLVFVTNIIADNIGTEHPSYGGVLTITNGFNDKWSGFIETQAYYSNYYKDGIFRGGAAYLVNDDMQIDASISTNVKTTPSILYGGVGFSWRFDKYYKGVDMDKAKKPKKTKRSKRR